MIPPFRLLSTRRGNILPVFSYLSQSNRVFPMRTTKKDNKLVFDE
jgi:hypothetical protein